MAAEKKEAAVVTFTKEQLVTAKRYANRRDALCALLEDGKQYTHADVEKALEDYMKGKVK